MQISKKRSKMILDAVHSAMNQVIGTFDPDVQEELNHPPEIWCSETKDKFDLLAEFQHKACENIEKVFNT